MIHPPIKNGGGPRTAAVAGISVKSRGTLPGIDRRGARYAFGGNVYLAIVNALVQLGVGAKGDNIDKKLSMFTAAPQGHPFCCAA